MRYHGRMSTISHPVQLALPLSVSSDRVLGGQVSNITAGARVSLPIQLRHPSKILPLRGKRVNVPTTDAERVEHALRRQAMAELVRLSEEMGLYDSPSAAAR